VQKRGLHDLIFPNVRDSWNVKVSALVVVAREGLQRYLALFHLGFP